MAISSFYKVAFFVSFIFCFNAYKQITLHTNKLFILFDSNNYNQCVISSKNKKSFCNDEIQLYIDKDSYYLNKKLITISDFSLWGYM